jgi:hypothetical protein
LTPDFRKTGFDDESGNDPAAAVADLKRKAERTLDKRTPAKASKTDSKSAGKRKLRYLRFHFFLL